MKKLSSQFVKGMDGEVAAWTWLADTLKLCGLLDTLQEWEHTMEDFSDSLNRHVFTRK
jgi:hypothetical protein